jgi:hypothetical protein
MPKGEKIKAKSDKWISYHLRNFENNRIELLVCQNSWLLWGEVLIMGNRGSF